jgi:alkylation response protein AidB-like acyl-CoA dehydrogenase
MTFTEEQEALRAAVRALLAHESEPWAPLCEQIGVAGLAVPERFGGLGTGLREAQIVAEELGRALSPVPFLGSAIVAAQAILASDDDDACARLLPRLVEGTIGALAWCGAEGGWPTENVPCRSTSDDRVTGRAHYVLDGDRAQILLVVAKSPSGLSLYEVDVTGAGVRRTPTIGLDQTRRLAIVEFDGARARQLGESDFSAPLRRVRNTACSILAAEQAGAAGRALEITVEHAKQRHQFGRPIGSFQALKHRMADLHVLVETARSAAYAAPDSERAATVAKVHCSEAFEQTAGEMIQLHGGIGITWDHPAHRYLKRAHGSSQLFGRPHEHLARLRELPVTSADTAE